jgi:hypothetical protein
MNRRLAIAVVAIVAVMAVSLVTGSRTINAAEQSWNGAISDSMCGASHAAMSTGGAKVSDRDCTIACVSYQTADAPKFVFVSEGKIYPIANQKFGGLARYAGQPITLTGELAGGTIAVSKIEKR